jgi:hypothetical protein
MRGNGNVSALYHNQLLAKGVLALEFALDRN